jgi:glutamyl-tRNA synthetase
VTDPGPAGQPQFGQPGQAPARPVRIRFAPSPSGPLHVNDVRAALYAWAFARHTGGMFVLRIDDSNQSQVTEENVTAAQEALHWLGLAWDEGPDQGGPYAPYRQSERIGLYHQWAQQFLDTGQAYWCYCSPEELQARRETTPAPGAPAPAPAGAPADYDRYCRTLTQQQAEAYLAEGRQPVLRFRMPDGATTFTDLIRGPITVEHRDVPDFVIMRGDGHPLPTLVTAVDDAMMALTHVVRDEDLLPFTPRQIAVYRAMGLPEDQFPVFAHLPRILGSDQQTLTRHNGVTSIEVYQRDGFVPEALVNYLTLLGWSPGEGPAESGRVGNSWPDYGLDQLVGGFELTQVQAAPVQFDPERLEAINAAKIRGLTPADFARRIVPFLAQVGLVTEPLSSDQMWFIRQGAPLIQDQLTRLTEAPDLLAFLLVPDSGFTVRAADSAAVLTADAATPLKAVTAALAALPEWTAPAIGQALRATLADAPDSATDPAPDAALAPVAVAVTGRRAAPPLPEALELLGRDRTLARLTAAQAAAQSVAQPLAPPAE